MWKIGVSTANADAVMASHIATEQVKDFIGFSFEKAGHETRITIATQDRDLVPLYHVASTMQQILQ
jgi:hypothetical protein